jgi:hypothetical protein
VFNPGAAHAAVETYIQALRTELNKAGGADFNPKLVDSIAQFIYLITRDIPGASSTPAIIEDIKGLVLSHPYVNSKVSVGDVYPPAVNTVAYWLSLAWLNVDPNASAAADVASHFDAMLRNWSAIPNPGLTDSRKEYLRAGQSLTGRKVLAAITPNGMDEEIDFVISSPFHSIGPDTRAKVAQIRTKIAPKLAGLEQLIATAAAAITAVFQAKVSVEADGIAEARAMVEAEQQKQGK